MPARASKRPSRGRIGCEGVAEDRRSRRQFFATSTLTGPREQRSARSGAGNFTSRKTGQPAIYQPQNALLGAPSAASHTIRVRIPNEDLFVVKWFFVSS
jgi:hypothetical protein